MDKNPKDYSMSRTPEDELPPPYVPSLDSDIHSHTYRPIPQGFSSQSSGMSSCSQYPQVTSDQANQGMDLLHKQTL